MNDLFDLKGQKAILTGGANGIGRAIAQGLHEHGVEVVIFDVSERIEEVAAEMAGDGAPVHGMRVDLSDRSAIPRAFAVAHETLGDLDILINAAGILIRQPSVDFPLEGWDKTMEINLTAVFELCQLAGRVMMERGRGKIVNIGSYNSIAGTEDLPAYCASKGGVKLLTMTLAAEWGPKGVYVNAIAPGYVETELSSGLRNDPEGYAESLKTIPLQRWGRVEDIVGPAVFLASRASDYVTGTALIVDGGRLSK